MHVTETQQNEDLMLMTSLFPGGDNCEVFYCVSDLFSVVLCAGCQEIADEFRSQEIDGQALLLLKEDHLMSTMNIKLGPALKIFARINMLKDS